MGLFTGIIGGAIKLGGKIIAKSRARKAARKEKRAKKKATKDAKLLESLDSARAALSTTGGPSEGLVGADEVAQSGNVLNLFKNLAGGGAAAEDVVTVADTPEKPSGIMEFLKTPFGMVVAVVGGFLLLKALKVIK